MYTLGCPRELSTASPDERAVYGSTSCPTFANAPNIGPAGAASISSTGGRRASRSTACAARRGARALRQGVRRGHSDAESIVGRGRGSPGALLGHVALLDPADRGRIAAAGGVQLVLRALRSHPAAAKVQAAAAPTLGCRLGKSEVPAPGKFRRRWSTASL